MLQHGSSVGHYRIVETLGAGGMGEVYRAHDTKLERDVALKVLPAHYAGQDVRIVRLRAEAKLLAALNHPNIASVYDLVEVDGTTLLVLELVEGESLDRRVKASGALPVELALRVARQVASAIEAAHARSIIHRDLKPANVILADRDTVKVLDFGIATRWEPNAKASSGDADLAALLARGGNTEGAAYVASAVADGLTDAGVIPGTVPYMSPEQLNGNPLDKRSDIWSFGCLMFELLAGRRPFDGRSLPSTVAAILFGEPEWSVLPAGTPPAAVKLLRRCLRKDPNDRLHDIADARIELDDLIPELAAEWSPRRRGRRVAIGVGGAAAAAFVLLFAGNVWGVRDRLFGRDLGFDPRAVGSLVALPSEVTVEGVPSGGLFAAPGENEQAYLTDAFPATLTASLAVTDQLDVRQPPTSVELASVDGDLDEVADLYGVSAFVASSVTVRSDTLEVALDLLDARTRSKLWGAQVAGPQDDYLSMTQGLAGELLHLLRPDARLGPTTGGTEGATSEAELALRRGQYHTARFRAYRRDEDYQRAMSDLGEALASDPHLGDAAAYMALLQGWRLEFGLGGPTEWDEIESLALEGQHADSTSGLALAVQPGFEAWFRRDGFEERRLESAVRAAALSPRSAIPHGILGTVLSDFSLSLAAESFREAIHIEPLLFSARGNLVASLTTAGRLEEALMAIDESRRIQSADQWATISTESSILSMLGRTAEAKPLLDQLQSLVDGGALPQIVLLEPQLEYTLASGDVPGARALLETVTQLIRSPQTPPQLVWNMVVAASSALALAGLLDEAFEILDLGIDRGALVPYDYLELNPRLASLRADPRYEAAAAPSRKRFEAMLHILQDARAQGQTPDYLNPAIEALVAQLGLG